jgi:hypothetical protein
MLQLHPAIPVLTPWEARMVKTFLIGTPKKDLAHLDATAGRKVSSILPISRSLGTDVLLQPSKCSCLGSEDENISAVERMLRLVSSHVLVKLI